MADTAPRPVLWNGDEVPAHLLGDPAPKPPITAPAKVIPLIRKEKAA